jgi:hypothetical protein
MTDRIYPKRRRQKPPRMPTLSARAFEALCAIDPDAAESVQQDDDASRETISRKAA